MGGFIPNSRNRVGGGRHEVGGGRHIKTLFENIFVGKIDKKIRAEDLRKVATQLVWTATETV